LAIKMPFSSGRPETLCGAGSMLEHTVSIRAWLPTLSRHLGIKSILDAPCGDFNWMAHTDLSGIDYIGVDFDPEHLARASETKSAGVSFAPKSKRLLELDIVNDRLPRADLMLCREFLQHLPNDRVHKVLENFRDSGCEWFVATSHGNLFNTDIAAAGMFRPLNLKEIPFSLPVPHGYVGDEPGSDRILGLWHRSDFE